MVVACIGLAVALSGASYAAVVLPRNSVGTPQLKKNAVNATKVKDRSLKATDFALGQLPAGPQGAKGDGGSQGPVGPQGPPGEPNPNAVNSDNLDNLDSTQFLRATGKAADANKLDGIDSTAFQRSCQSGAIHARAVINASSTFPTAYTSDSGWVQQPFNCTGGTIKVKRVGDGWYTIELEGFDSNRALAGGVQESLGHFVAVNFTAASSGGDYEFVRYDVVVRQDDGTRDDVDFAVFLF